MSTEEQRTALRDYILGDPALAAMASGPGTDYAAIVAAVNAPVTPRVGKAAAATVLRWAARHDVVFKLRTASQGGNSAVRALADAALSIISSPHIPELNLADPEIAGMMQALVAANVFSNQQADDLFDLATTLISKAEELYGQNIGVSELGGILG